MKTTLLRLKRILSSMLFLVFTLSVPQAFAQCADPPAGLVAWWPGAGNGEDIAGGNSGTWAGNAAYGSGKVGQGFVLDGTSGLNVSNAVSFQLQDFTIETWIKRASTTLTTLRPWPYSWDNNGVFFSTGAYNGYVFFLDGGGHLVLGKSMVSSVALPSPTITDTNFHHVAVTKSGSTVIFYIDGMGYAVPAYGPVFVSGTTAAIGMHPEIQQSCFLGTIDELAFYGRALTSSAIQAIYAAGPGGKCQGPGVPATIRVSQVEICWGSDTNSRYQVQYRSDLTTNVWAPLVECVAGGTSNTCVTDAVLAGMPQRFYRVVRTNCIPTP